MVRLLAVAVLAAVLITPVSVAAQDAYCTLGQYVYGNANTSYNGMEVPSLLDSLITDGDPLVIGMPGRGVTFMDGSEPCIIAGLTASWKPVPLPEDLGDAVVDSTCELPPGFPAKKNGKFRNALLGETVALSLNTRLDPDLAGLEVCPIMSTVAALPGEDGLYGTADDSLCAECDTMTIRIPGDVLAALGDTSGAFTTIADILGLANLTLAGQDTLFDVTPKQVHQAVKVINRGFKRCRFLVDCTEVYQDSIYIVDTKVATRPDGVNEEGRSETGFAESALALYASSPVSDVATIRFSIPEPCRVRLSVYNVAGREVGVVVDGDVISTDNSVRLPVGGGRLSSGVYFLRLQAVGLTSGLTYAQTNKLLVLR